MAKLTFSYKECIDNYMSAENPPPPLPEKSIVILENKQDVVDVCDFNERDLRYLMMEYKLDKIILQCQKCRNLRDLQYDHLDDSIMIFENKNTYSICSCGGASIHKRYRTRTRQVQLCFKNF